MAIAVYKRHMSTKSIFTASRFPAMTRQQARLLVSLVLIVLLHFFFVYAILSGWFKQVEQDLSEIEQVVPKEITVSLIAPEKIPEPVEHTPPELQPIPPKPVPVVNKPVIPPPVIPVINKAPPEQAIITPPVPPQPPVSPKPVEAPMLPEPVPIAPAAPPAPPPQAPQLKTISKGVEYLQPPAPEYPSLSRRLGEEGRVTLRVLVNEMGRPTRADILKSSGSQRLDEAARQAVLRAVFKPHIEDGRATTVYAIVPIAFYLNN